MVLPPIKEKTSEKAETKKIKVATKLKYSVATHNFLYCVYYYTFINSGDKDSKP